MTPWAYMSRVAEPAQKYHPVAILNQKPARPKKLPPGSPERRLQRFGGPSEYLGDVSRAAVAAQGTSLGPFCRPSRSISRSVSKVRW